MKHFTQRSTRRRIDIIDRTDREWYKDAIIYQLHVKAFQDSNGDGIGDFAGLMERLDHIQQLGATAIWMLPFYPSPLRDDGYDIAEFKAVNPSYGKLADFRALVNEAHRRGLRVITELVINHTSDQHPWFQRARHSKPGSAARDFYVWSDTDTKFPETRIIFLDTEKSNWTWDPVAGAFYWHRFYSHQPDLNFDNPRVLREVLRVMHFWLDMGVDGLRLDAIPYLVEREGTNNENLPETHAILKQIRAELNAHYPDRMLLAEANQWPEDTRPYFGEGDECQMGFHFPLMPRMYMAVAQEDRHPITDIIRQTPEIPPNCQWGIFLRNHDELTLEMVTDSERDYLWQTYAEDSRARINLGIRRRLAPLMQNDRRKIELMNSLLLSMPGTPIIYYGDEIGMGDNYYLGDRDGVRTPMQWSSDRNAGFSRSDPQRLYLPLVMDATYGYQAINVESQDRDRSSLLNWMRRIVSVRKNHQAFGRGSMILLYPRNRKILAYVREYEGERILCVANLSAAAQAVELDLAQWKGAVPIELAGRSPFPPIGTLPYLITLAGYGFYWFLLAEETAAPQWHVEMPDVLPEFVTLTTRDQRIETALSGRDQRHFDQEILPEFLRLQRWFAGKDQQLGQVTLQPLVSLSNGQYVLSVIDAQTQDGDQRYLMPLSARWGEENVRFGAPKLSYTIAKLRRGSTVGALLDGSYDENLAATLLDHLRRGGSLNTSGGGLITFQPSERLASVAVTEAPRLLGVEQSNVSVAFGDQIILKIYRRLRSGVQPDVEMSSFLTQSANFQHTPAFLGSVEYQSADEEVTTLAVAFEFVRNQGDAWSAVTEALRREVDEFAHEDSLEEAAGNGETATFQFPLSIGALLGQRTAEFHSALATESQDAAFSAEMITDDDLKEWVAEVSDDVRATLGRLRTGLSDGSIHSETAATDLLDREDELLALIGQALRYPVEGLKTRIHGDFHLGQILVAKGDLIIIDFEGEPNRSLEARRSKFSPLRDVAGMLRSFAYAASAVERTLEVSSGPREETIRARLNHWLSLASTDFLNAYLSHGANDGTPARHQLALLDLFVVQKAIYEIRYELANRPSWAEIPIRGLLQMLDRSSDLAEE